MTRRGLIFATRREALGARDALEAGLGLPWVGAEQGVLGRISRTKRCRRDEGLARTDHLLAVHQSHRTSEWILEIPDDLAGLLARIGRPVAGRVDIAESHSQPVDDVRGR